MKVATRLACWFLFSTVILGQPDPAPPRFRDAAGLPLALQSDEQIERFLATAEVRGIEEIGDGVSGARRVVLAANGVRLHAIFRDIRTETAGRPRPSGRKIVLRDDCIFEMAAYRLDRLLGIGRVPPSVQRTIEGRPGTLQLWIENAVTEKARRSRGMATTEAMERAWQQMLLFDNLIFNDDRNRGNVVYDAAGRLWMIDHTRAFREYTELPYPEAVERIEPALWRRLNEVADEQLEATLGPYLRAREVESLLARRRLIIEYLTALIEERGAAAVLYDAPR